MNLKELQEKLGQTLQASEKWTGEGLAGEYPKNVTKRQLFEALAIAKTNAARIDTELSGLYAVQGYYTEALNTATGETPPTLAGAIVTAISILNRERNIQDTYTFLLSAFKSQRDDNLGLSKDLVEVERERDDALECVRAQATLLGRLA